MDKKIAMVGVGNMGGAIAMALAKKGYSLILSNRSLEKLEKFKSFDQVEITRDNREACEKADYIFIGVKPQQMEALVEDLKDSLQKPLVSMVMGKSLGDMKALLGHKKLVRIMPNTPAQVGESMTAAAFGQDLDSEERQDIQELLMAFGAYKEVPEDQFSAFCALCGCMPAFIDLFIEGASDGAVYCGLKRQDSYEFLAQTLKGVAKLLEESKKHPGVLKDEVTSPAGSTIKGVHELEKGSFRYLISQAVITAAKNS